MSLKWINKKINQVIGGATDAVMGGIEGGFDLVGDVAGAASDVINFAVDEIIQPVLSGVEDTIQAFLDDPVTTIAKMVAYSTGQLWAIPLIDGASTIAKGGDLDDALKSAAVSYVSQASGEFAGKWVSPEIAKAGYSNAVNTAVTKGIEGGVRGATTAVVYGQDPLQAFVTGGVNAAVGATLGEIANKLDAKFENLTGDIDLDGIPLVNGWEDLQDGIKDSVVASLTAEFTGGEVSADQLLGMIGKYTGVSKTMSKFLSDNTGLDAGQVALMTSALTNAATTALAGNPELSGEAFFGTFDKAGMDALKDIIDKPVNAAIDKVSGASASTLTAAKALNEALTNASGAAAGFNSTREELNGRILEQDRLKGVYDGHVAALGQLQTNAGNMDDPVTAGAIDAQGGVEAYAKIIQAAANEAADAYNTYAAELKIDYDTTYKPALDAYQETYDEWNPQVAGLEDAYAEQNQYLMSDIDDLGVAMKPVFDGVTKASALALRPGIDEDAYRKLNGLDAGVDVYDHFLQQGQKLPTDLDGANAVLSASHGDLIKQILATEGMDVSSMEPESLRAVGEHVVNNVKSIKDITGLDFDSFASEALNKAREATPEGGVLPEGFSREDGILDSDIANGKATLGVTSTGELQWQNTKKRNERLTGSGSGSYTIEDLERSMAAQMDGVISVKFVGTAPTLPEMINMAMEGDFGSLSTATLGTIASLNNETGRLLDEYVNTPIYDNAKAVYNYLNEETDGGLGNAGSVVVGAGGEILQTVAGLAVLAGANPNNSLGRTAKNMIALSGDMKSDEWKAAAEEMQANSANYDAEWRAANPGKEPSMAQKAYLKTAAIFGNIKDHPVQWISENVVSELLQEVPILLASGGTGNVAKRLLLEAGEAHAKKVAARVAIGTGITIDAAEAFGGTAAGAFDEAYSTALNTGMSAQEATDYAIDVAQKAGTIAFITMAATAGVGGQALSKSLFGDKGSEFFAESYDAIKKQVTDGVKVTVKEGVTEGIEEALPQLYIGTALHQIDPSYDVVGSVAEAAVVGKIAGAGTAGGIYTGNALADSLLTTNSTVKNAVANSGDATKATQALKDLGISDNEVLNNLLNTTYDAQYVTTTEAGEMFTVENPGFIPTDAEIEALAGKKDESNLAAEVAAYVDPRFLDVDEVKAAAAAEGVTLTDEQAAAYVGQKNEADAVADIAAEYDPQGTTRDEAEQFFADVGYTPTEEEIAARIGATPETEQKEDIAEYVDPRQVTEAEARKFYEDLGYNPTDAEVAAIVGQGGNNFEGQKETGVETYVDPRQVTEDEARKFFSDLGYTPTDEEVADFTAQVAESEQKTAIDKYVDPRFVTQDEVQAIADAEGLTLTEALAATYLGQKDQESTLAAATAEFDPLATTTSEAKAFFEAQGFTPTDQQVANFVASKTEEGQKAAIAEFVDPRQVTTDEAKALFDALGYNPTDAEVADFVGQGEADFATAAETGVATYVDPRMVDADEVSAAYADLGLSRPTDADIQALIGQYMETDLAGRAEENLPTARYNSIMNILDNFTGEVGVSDEMKEALETVKGDMIDALGDLGLEVAAIDQAVNDVKAAVDALPVGASPEDVSTAINDAISGLENLSSEDVNTAITTALEGMNNLSADDVQGIIDDTVAGLNNLSADDVQGIIDTALEGLPETASPEDVSTAINDAISGLENISAEDVDTAITTALEGMNNLSADDVQGIVDAATGTLEGAISELATDLTKLIEDNAGDVDTALAELAADLGTTEEALLAELDTTKEALSEQFTEGLSELETDLTKLIEDNAGDVDTALAELAADLGTTEEALLAELDTTKEALSEQFTAGLTALEEDIGGVVAGVDDLAALVEDYEAAGVDRDTAISLALEQLSTELGQTETDILAELGLTEAELGERIDASTEQLSGELANAKADLLSLIEANEAAGLTRDEATQAAIGELASAFDVGRTELLTAIGETEASLTSQITDVETGLTETIGDVETSLGADIEAVADLIGKPARDVTQTDIDFVIDLIAQENVSQELITQYDVNADGTVDIADQTLLETALQGDQDVTLADTSMFTPATGLYLQQEQDTQATQDLMTELNTQLNTQINTQDQQQKLRDLVSMEQQGLFKGAKTTVSSADPMNIDYLYDFNSVFANPSQEGLFASPYSTTTRNKAANQPTGPMPTASGFAEGGQVEDENDMLLRILGEM
jgi:hypothetical protein